jgi:hypothetical protein
MTQRKGTTPTKEKQKQKNTSYCENVELEFTQRFLTLFTSFYDNPSLDEVTAFPPAPPKEDSGDMAEAPAKPPPFHSSVWDLRLKKAVENRLTNDEMASASLSEQVLQLRDSLAAQAPDLNDVFVPRRAPRPTVPLYIQNIDRDRKEILASMKPPGRAQATNAAELDQLFSERLRRQKAMGRQRAERRKRKRVEVERETLEFVGKLHKTKLGEGVEVKPVDITIKQKEIENKRKMEKLQELRMAEKVRLEVIKNSPRKQLRWDPAAFA